MRLPLTLAALLFAPFASAATITQTAPWSGGTDFAAQLGQRGDITTPVGRFTGSQADGLRMQQSYDEWDRGDFAGVDSRWSNTMRWTLPEGATGLRFNIQDAFDRPTTAAMTMRAGDASYAFSERLSGTLLGFEITGLAAGDYVLFHRTGKPGVRPCANERGRPTTCDGWTLANPSILFPPEPRNILENPETPSPVPVPAAGWMLLTALGGMLGLRRVRG